MSAAVKGKQIIWGIAAGAITAATNVLTNAGVVQSFEIDSGGGTTVIGDEDDDVVARVDHAAENKLSMEVHCVSATVKPAKGAEISGASLGTIDGIDFTVGRTFVDNAKATYAQGGVKKISMTATHYPTMAADA